MHVDETARSVNYFHGRVHLVTEGESFSIEHLLFFINTQNAAGGPGGIINAKY